MLFMTQISEEGKKETGTVDDEAPPDFPIDPALTEGNSQMTVPDDGQLTSRPLGDGGVSMFNDGLVNEFDPFLWEYGYGGQDQREGTTTPNPSSLNSLQTPYSHTFQWSIHNPGQPQPSLSAGDPRPPADSLTAESEHGDKEFPYAKTYSRGLNTSSPIGIDLNTAKQATHTYSATQQQPSSQGSSLSIGLHHNHNSIYTTFPTQTASLDADSLPPSDPHYEQIAQFQAAFTGTSEDNPTSQTTLEFDAILTINGPKAAALREAVKDEEKLVDVINYILTADWYKDGGKEELPDRTLRKHIPKRRGPDAKDSPFGAFVSEYAPYTCLFCNDQKSRSLGRAIGHARSHFGYKIDGVHTNLNAKLDRERRAKSPTHMCENCHVPITKQNRARHERSTGHKQKASLSNATASTSAQQ